MNNEHHPGHDDRSLDDDLDKLARAYQKTENTEPPHMLDQAVLGRAHRAVAKKPRWTQFGWRHGLTTAAVMVLAIAIFHFQHTPAPPEPVDQLRQMDDGLDRKRVNESDKTDHDSRFRDAAPGVTTGAAERRQMPAANSPVPQSNPSVRSEKAATVAGALLEESVEAVDEPRIDRVAKEAESVLTSGKDVSRGKLKTDAETRLDAILALKKAGDDNWRGALQEFIKTYPDYPLPDGLNP